MSEDPRSSAFIFLIRVFCFTLEAQAEHPEV